MDIITSQNYRRNLMEVLMGSKLLKEIGEKIVVIDGIKIRVTIKMMERDYPTKGEILFIPHAKFFNELISPTKLLRERYSQNTGSGNND